MTLRKRSLMILFVALLSTLAFSTSAVIAQEEGTSAGCSALDGSGTPNDGTPFTIGPADFLEGEMVSITVTGGDMDATFELSVNGSVISTGNELGIAVTYTIPADDEYTIVVTASSPGAVDVTITVNCTPVEDEEDDDGKVTICHFPPGNPDNAKTITVGAPAVDAHVRNHGDTIGACSDEVESEYVDPDNSIIVIVLDETGVVVVTGDCDDDGCSTLATIVLAELEPVDGGEFPFDDDLSDEYYVIVYYLGYQDRDGDGEFAQVYQINLYREGEVLPVSDNVLLLQKDDGTWLWDTNSNANPIE